MAGLVLVGVNLRPARSSPSPVLKQVAAGTGLSGATAGLLTTLPVVCLGVFAPAAAVLARRVGAERTVGGLLIALALGIASRSAGGIVALFAGTLAAGACIGVMGILLPGSIERVALWRRPIAWQVTLYMGLQSSLAYCVFRWMPVILQDRGLSAVQSGMVVAVSVLVQLITALGGPFIARLGRDQRPTVLLMMLMTWAGLMGCLYAPVSTLW